MLRRRHTVASFLAPHCLSVTFVFASLLASPDAQGQTVPNNCYPSGGQNYACANYFLSCVPPDARLDDEVTT